MTYKFVHDPDHRQTVKVNGGQITVNVTIQKGKETVDEVVTLWANIQLIDAHDTPTGPPIASNEGLVTLGDGETQSFTFPASANRRYQVVVEGFEGTGFGHGSIVLTTKP